MVYTLFCWTIYCYKTFLDVVALDGGIFAKLEKGWDERGRPVSYLISANLRDRTKVNRLSVFLKKFLDNLQKKSVRCSMSETAVGPRRFFLLRFGSVRHRRKWRTALSRALADFICDSIEPDLIRRMIRQELHSHAAGEISQIEQVVLRLLESSAWERENAIYASRQEKLADQIATFVEESPKLAVDGFVRFRMKAHCRVLAACVKEAIHDYRLDQEYKEFIRLLRHFVQMQPPKTPLVHVIHEDKGRFRLLGADGAPYVFQEVTNWFREFLESPFSHEDYVVSALLTVVPDQVVLHTKNPEQNVIRTLVQIFEGRIMICDGCGQCRQTIHCGKTLD
jgi:putative sporulation protein YtxC